MRKTFIKTIAAALTLLAAVSCTSSLKNIAVTDCKLSSVEAVGLHGVDAILAITVNNPAGDILVRDMLGQVKLKGQPVLDIKAEDVQVDRKSEKCYNVPVKGTLSQNLNVFYLLGALSDPDIKALSVDFSANVKMKNGVGTTLSYKDVPLEVLMNDLKLFK